MFILNVVKAEAQAECNHSRSTGKHVFALYVKSVLAHSSHASSQNVQYMWEHRRACVYTECKVTAEAKVGMCLHCM